MKRLFASTAIAMCLSGPVVAQSAAPMFLESKGNLDFYASDLIGQGVYTTEADVVADMTVDSDALGDWDRIGEIDDIVVDTNGKVLGAIVGVGGFLGIDEKDVAIDMSSFKYVRDEDDADTYYLVLNSTEEELTGAPEFEWDAKADTHASVETDDGPMMRNVRETMTPPQVEREGYRMTSIEELRTENLQGAAVYGIDDEHIGEIGDLIVSDDGKIVEAIIDVGGFLGMGEKEVALGFDELTILQSDDGDVVRVYVDTTEEYLEEMPEFSRS